MSIIVNTTKPRVIVNNAAVTGGGFVTILEGFKDDAEDAADAAAASAVASAASAEAASDTEDSIYTYLLSTSSAIIALQTLHAEELLP